MCQMSIPGIGPFTSSLCFSYSYFSIKILRTNNITSWKVAKQPRRLVTLPYFARMPTEAIEKITFFSSNFGDVFDTQLMLAVDSMQSFGKNETILVK